MVNILMCSNGDAFDGIILTSLSLVKHTDSPITLYIGTMSLTDVDARFTAVSEKQATLLEKILKESNPDSRVILWDTEEYFRKELMDSKNIKSAYTPYAIIRLFADKLEEDIEKLLYLDTDVLFLDNVEKLYTVNLEGYHLGAVKDYYGRFFINPRYINSGVMLWNMPKMREDGVFARSRKLCKEKKMLLPDQSAINRYAKRKLFLSRRFNEQHGIFSDTVIQHFSMRIKWFPIVRTHAVKPWHEDLLINHPEFCVHKDVIETWEKIKRNDYVYE